MDRHAVLSAVGEFYEAALDPEGAGRLGDAFRRAAGVRSNLVFLANHRTGALERLIDVSGNFDEAARRDYAAHYHAINPWYRSARLVRPPYVARGQELIADRDLERSEFGADWCGRTDIFHMIGGVQLVEGDIVVASGIHRPRSEEAFDLDERQAYALVLEHLGRAFRIAMRLGLLRGREAVSLDVIERLETGILLIRCDGELVFANPIAEKLLRANRWFSCRHKRIKPIYADDADRFAAEIASAGAAAASDNHGAPFAVRDPIEGALLLQILPFRPSAPIADASGACAVVMFRDPDRRKAIWPDSLVQAFGLTRAEARLVARLQEEESLTAAAATLGVSEATARTQLKSVFAKTGFRRQGELFGAIGANPLFRR